MTIVIGLDKSNLVDQNGFMELTLAREDELPLYLQIVHGVIDLIERGILTPGSRLPTVRRMAQDYQLGRMTVQTAYSELQAQGWTESVVGRGTFVAARPQISTFPRAILPRVEVPGSLASILESQGPPARLFLAQATPAEETFPVRDFKACLSHAMQNPEHLAYGSILGDDELRIQMSRALLSRGLTVSPEALLITSGAQQAIDLAVRTFTTPDQSVAVEAPAYPGVLEILSSRRQRSLEVPVNSEGLSLVDLERLCERDRPALVYTVPTYQNPTGTVTSIEHRKRLVEMAEEYDFYILEDDVYGDLNLVGKAPHCLKAFDETSRVIYLTSFSKALMPALRLGALVATPSQLMALSHRKQATDLITSPLLQAALAEFLRRGYYKTHLKKVRELYLSRRDHACQLLKDLLPECRFYEPSGGLSLWIELPPEVDEAELYLKARQEGVVVARGEAFFHRSQPRGYLRLSFTHLNKVKFRQAICVLRTLIEEQKTHRSRSRNRTF